MSAPVKTKFAKPLWGASISEWSHFQDKLKLAADIVPIVSNLEAKISPNSKMSALGKVPSRYNATGLAAGFSGWTEHVITDLDMRRWRKEPDYGFGIRTGGVGGTQIYALDADVLDATEAAQVNTIIEKHLGVLPMRTRPNSTKFLVPLRVADVSLQNRDIKTTHGHVELLGTGHQFAAIGTHPSDVRYVWEDGLPDEIPFRDIAKLEACWAEIVKELGVAEPTTAKAATKTQTLMAAAENDPVAVRLHDLGMVLGQDKSGRLDIDCPFEHSTDNKGSSTSYFVAHTGGYADGAWKCLHASCADKTQSDFLKAIDMLPDLASQFDDLPPRVDQPPAKGLESLITETPSGDGESRFKAHHAHDFADAPPARYIIKGVLPQAELAVIYGESASGKTFAVLDLAIAVATGREWRGKRTHKGRVCYVCAEGANFFRGRLKAWVLHQEKIHKEGERPPLTLRDIDLHIIGAAPSLIDKEDVIELAKELRRLGPLQLVVVDTLAAVMAGGDENSGVDMGRMLQHCKLIHKLTGALVLLVHHSGKDASRGARGWSGLRAACDAEFEVTRNDNHRAVTVSKLKDGADGTRYDFKLLPVQIGMDEDNEIIESCVVQFSDGPARRPQQQMKNQEQKITYSVILELLSLGGDGTTDPAVRAAAVPQLSYDATPGANGKPRKDQRGRDVGRAIDWLTANGYITNDGGRINIIEEAAE